MWIPYMTLIAAIYYALQPFSCMYDTYPFGMPYKLALNHPSNGYRDRSRGFNGTLQGSLHSSVGSITRDSVYETPSTTGRKGRNKFRTREAVRWYTSLNILMCYISKMHSEQVWEVIQLPRFFLQKLVPMPTHHT